MLNITNEKIKGVSAGSWEVLGPELAYRKEMDFGVCRLAGKWEVRQQHQATGTTQREGATLPREDPQGGTGNKQGMKKHGESGQRVCQIYHGELVNRGLLTRAAWKRWGSPARFGCWEAVLAACSLIPGLNGFPLRLKITGLSADSRAECVRRGEGMKPHSIINQPYTHSQSSETQCNAQVRTRVCVCVWT